MYIKSILVFILILFLNSCSKDELVYKPTEKIDPYATYQIGLEAFQKNNFFFANNKFSEAELNFENVDYAAKSSIMASFSLYGINFYSEAEENLERFLKTYPGSSYVVYAHYLLSIIYFEQITDEKKDLEPLIKAKNKINFFLNEYPNSEYAIDLNFKKDLIINQLAAKELYIAKFYIKTQKWAAAIKRLKNILTEYDKTIFIEEALHRLVEIHYHIGLVEEAEKYASILGYNYNSSEWYQQSYKILNKEYKITKKKIKDEKAGFFKRIIKSIK